MAVKIIIDTMKKSGYLGNIGVGVSKTLMEHNALSRLNRFRDNIKGKRILDVGLGTGSMTYVLNEMGYELIGLDIVNTSFYPHIAPVIYDGVNMPLGDKSMDMGLLICVLHHCDNPMRVLEETMRVCKRIVIIEDTYRNDLEKILVSARDNVGNFEFYQHEYYPTADWLRIFRKLGWYVIKTEEWSSIEFYGMYGRQTLFVIEQAQ